MRLFIHKKYNMEHTYNLEGMTCGGCEAKVKKTLLSVEGVQDVKVSKEENIATVTSHHSIPIKKFKAALMPIGEKYKISEQSMVIQEEVKKSWIATYKPILLIFSYIFSISLLIELSSGGIDYLRWMRHFMAGFFLTFSFFKMLNLEGFKNSYLMYDVIARKFPTWGYIYAFMELILGIAYLVNFYPLITNIVTTVIMSVSIIGVLQTVLNKQKIKCACLGDVFNLPMSEVTIIEDGLMIVMSLSMVIMYLS